MTFALTPKEIASFDGRYRIVSVRGPLTLFRLCGKTASGEANNPYGRFWFNEKFFWNLINLVTENAHNTRLVNHYLRFLLREVTAVCHDWNTFAAIYQLTLPAARPIELAVGRIAAQPYFSASDPQARRSAPHEVLAGGEFQYLVDFPGDPSLKTCVQGPRPLWVHGRGRA